VWSQSLIGAALIFLINSLYAQAADIAALRPDPAVVTSGAGSWLFGDWSGARTRLREMGVDFQFQYTGELGYNPTGGTESTARYANQFTAGATFDLERLLDVPAAKFQVTLTQRTGKSLSEDAQLGTFQPVQEVYGRGHTIRLTDFWYQQQFANGLVDWKIGRMPFNEDFAAFPCDFQNLVFCGADPGKLVGNYIYNLPISQWATRAKFNLNGFGYFELGAYDANPKYLGFEDQVLPVFFSDSTGVIIPVELAWLPKFRNGSLPGSYKIGGWYDTSQANDVADDSNGDPFLASGLPPRVNRGRYGSYLAFQQQVSENLTLFLNAVFADRRTSRTDRQIAAGFIYKSPFRSRPQDDIGFAVASTHLNDRIPGEDTSSEYDAELYYTYRPMNGLLVRPNIQYVYHAGGKPGNDAVVVLGLKTSVTF
jgi:porin